MDNPISNARLHSLTLENRKKLTMTGIENVESFNDKEVYLKLSDGGLSITGLNLSVEKLNVDDGQLTVTGEISGIRYNVKKTNIIGRIFK